MMAVALDREPLDALVWRVLGRASPLEEQLLAANPGLAAKALALPAGTEIRLPDIDPGPPQRPLIQLWD